MLLLLGCLPPGIAMTVPQKAFYSPTESQFRGEMSFGKVSGQHSGSQEMLDWEFLPGLCPAHPGLACSGPQPHHRLCFQCQYLLIDAALTQHYELAWT